MAFDSFLIHTCTIVNPSTSGLNAYNNASKAWSAPVTGVMCRLIEMQDKVWSDERQADLVQTVYKLLLPSSVNISERAKISQITMEDGTAISDTFVVTEVLTRRANSARHKMVMLERVS